MKFKAEFSTDISESPKGNLSVSKTKVRPGAAVDFTVDFDAEDAWPTSCLDTT